MKEKVQKHDGYMISEVSPDKHLSTVEVNCGAEKLQISNCFDCKYAI